MNRWRQLDRISTAVVVLLACAAAASLALVGTLINRTSFASDVENGSLGFTSRASAIRQADAVDGAVQAAATALVVAILACGICFIVWEWRCAKNAQLLAGTTPRFGPGWAIGGWFIPLANLVIPVLVMQDLWRATARGSDAGDSSRTRPGSALVGWWWAAVVTGAVLTRVRSGDVETIDELQRLDTLGIIGGIVTVVAAFLAIRLVRELTARLSTLRPEMVQLAG